MIRVLLVDDRPLVRSGFRALLDLEDDIEVVAEAADARDARELAGLHLPGVALVDIHMPVMDGIGATRRIAADPAPVGVHVVMLTNYGMDEHVFDALRAGAAGFLVKDVLRRDRRPHGHQPVDRQDPHQPGHGRAPRPRPRPARGPPHESGLVVPRTL